MKYIRTENGIYDISELTETKSNIKYDGSQNPKEIIEKANGYFIKGNKLYYRDCWQCRYYAL